MPKHTKALTDTAQELTDAIVASLAEGTAPWRCPWDTTGALAAPANRSTGRPYNGMNVLLLWIAQLKGGFASAEWLTFRQAQALGGGVRKGEKGSSAIFYRTIEREDRERTDANGDPLRVTIPVIRRFTVFNVDQVEGVEPAADAMRPRYGFAAVGGAERVLAASGVPIHHGGTTACYVPGADTIHMPDRDRFASADDYYATALHELTHATKHRERCDRRPYSDDHRAYAFEELVAELGSLFLKSSLNLGGSVVGHDSYIDHWRQVLAADKRAIFRAAGQAQAAHDWLMAAAFPQAEAAA